MKRIQLIEERSQTFGLSPEAAEADRVDYIACIRQVIRAPMNPMSGVGLEEMEKGLRVLKALDGKVIGDVLELEDSDHQHLCEKVRNARWAVVDERLVRFSHTILNATETILGDPTTTPHTAGSAPVPSSTYSNGVSAGPANRDPTSDPEPVSAADRMDRSARSVRPGRKPSSA